MSDVTVTQMGPTGMVALKGDILAMGAALNAVTGCAVPAQRRIETADMSVAWMAPDELLILCDHAAAPDVAADLSKRLAKVHHLAVDISDARVGFVLDGGTNRDVLAKLTPADLGALALGEMRRTRLAQVPAAIWLETETRARVICFRSVGQYVHDLLVTSADPATSVGFY
ncbi:sarcosine oxidase subunit gamma family protein [Gymnodinialimonas sp. 2305UL16-5]|uniref:sarcosine oxidase subunit gamma n=1 Tax=Gymnodinialimonas mytili TaxID=3126503 RepID=UPI003097E9C3